MANSHPKIILLGFMGCGKSTIGKAISIELGQIFIDLDEVIEIRNKASIGEIFENVGENTFRHLETQTLALALNLQSAVVSLGGGTPCFNNNMSSINKNNETFYLKLSAATLAERLFKEKDHRPLIKEYKSIEDLTGFIESKLQERDVFYHQAKYIINADQEVNALSREIISLLDS
jgi:shikimate kinase